MFIIRKRMSIRASLYFMAALSTFLMLLLGVVNLHSLQRNSQSLSNVYERAVVPSATLSSIQKKFDTLRFNMASIMFDKVSFGDASKQLDQLRMELPRLWQQFKDAKAGVFSEEEARLVEIVDKQMGLLPPFYKLLELAYSSSDKTMARSVLDDDWPPVEQNLLNPLVNLVAMQEQLVKETYGDSLAMAGQQRMVVLAVLIFGLLAALTSSGLIARNIGQGVKVLEEALSRVSQGELGVKVVFRHDNEFGDMARHLERTLESLRGMMGEVTRHALSVADEAGRLAREVEIVEQSSRTQSDEASSTAAAIEEITSSLEMVSERVNETRDTSRRASDLCDNGRKVVDQTQRELSNSSTTVKQSAEMVAGLGERSNEISRIVEVIRSIAEQTNLLALNAAIEAARAGETGRGFAVVADEVRKLAERTQQATADIGATIVAIQAEIRKAVVDMDQGSRTVEGAVGLANQTVEALDLIDNGAKETAHGIGEISVAADQQRAASQDVSSHIEKIAGMSESNLHSIGNLSRTIHRLQALSLELQGVVSRFRTG